VVGDLHLFMGRSNLKVKDSDEARFAVTPDPVFQVQQVRFP
jgi:hypothetical protein